MKVFRFLKDTKDRTIESISNFKGNPLDCLGQIIPVLIGLTAFVGFVVAFAMFIVSGGYTVQVDFFKANGFDDISEAFTNGTVYIINKGVVPVIINVLLLTEFIVMMIVYFKRENKAMKILVIIDLAIVGIFAGIAGFLSEVYSRKIELPENMQEIIVNVVGGMQYSAFRTAILVTLFVAAVVFFILALIAKSRWMVSHTAVSLLIAYVAFPLLLLFLENVIPMVVGIVFLAIIGGIIWFIFTCVIGGEESDNSSYKPLSGSLSGSGGKKNNSGDEREKAIEKKINTGSVVREKDCAYIPDYNKTLGLKLFKVKGMTHDYVEVDNGIASSEICDLEMLRKGKFHIYEADTMREIRENEIPWRK